MSNQERKLSRRDFIRASVITAAGAATVAATTACERDPLVNAFLVSVINPQSEPVRAAVAPTLPPLEKLPPKLEILPPPLETILHLDPVSSEVIDKIINNPSLSRETIFIPEGAKLPEYFPDEIRFWEKRGFIDRWSKLYGVDKIDIASLMIIESWGYLFALSPAGAISICQVMPFHFSANQNPWDPKTNAAVGLTFYRTGLEIAKKKGYKDLEAKVQAARGYNGGHGVIGIDFSQLHRETQVYDRLFRAFMTGDKETTDIYCANATKLHKDAERWVKEQENQHLVTLPLNNFHSVMSHNVRRLAELRNYEIVIKNGQDFNYLETTKPYSAERGFQTYEHEGDGACYDASAIYQAVVLGLIPGLTAERTKNHPSIAGIDDKFTVTIFYSNRSTHNPSDLNLFIRNSCGNPVVIHTEIKGNQARYWVEIKPTETQQNKIEIVITKEEAAKRKLDQLLAIHYKKSGYKDNQGHWCTWDGISQPAVDNIAGLNCGGFLLECARALYGSIDMGVIQKQPFSGRTTTYPEWLLYGYDEVVSLAKQTGGQNFKTDGLNWEEGSGFSVKDWKILGTKLRKGYVYFASVNKPEKSTGRIHHHVATILPTDGGILVYESIEPQSQVVVLEDFLRKYLQIDQNYRVFLTESPLLLENSPEHVTLFPTPQTRTTEVIPNTTFKPIFGRVVENGPRDLPKIALTFDADMTPSMIEELRNRKVASYYNRDVITCLEKEGVPATIFMAGLWAEQYPDITKALANNPLFEIGNHSYSHPAFQPCYGLLEVNTKERKLLEIEKAQIVLKQTTGKSPDLFRFPGGCNDASDLQLVNQSGLTAVGWDVISGDALNSDANSIIKCADQVKNGSILVFHLHGGNKAPKTAEALPSIIASLRRKGFSFVKVTELLSAPAS